MGWLRGIRAALGIGITWATLWAITGVVLGLILDLSYYLRRVGTSLSDSALMVGRFALAFGIIGAINGMLFSVVLATLGRQLRDRLRLPVVGAFGAVAGAVLPVIFSITLRLEWFIDADTLSALALVIATSALIGALSAIATFAIAQPSKNVPASAVS